MRNLARSTRHLCHVMNDFASLVVLGGLRSNGHGESIIEMIFITFDDIGKAHRCSIVTHANLYATSHAIMLYSITKIEC